VTIPDIGHCAGGGSSPLDGSIRGEGEQRSGVCSVCSRRVELHDDGSLVSHHSIGQADLSPGGGEND
jgi:hypothetical protein